MKGFCVPGRAIRTGTTRELTGYQPEHFMHRQCVVVDAGGWKYW
jgi:hypothetical protein